MEKCLIRNHADSYWRKVDFSRMRFNQYEVANTVSSTLLSYTGQKTVEGEGTMIMCNVEHAAADSLASFVENGGFVTVVVLKRDMRVER